MNSRSSKKALACCGEGVCSLDIRILKVYSNLETYGESIVSICNELNLELNQIRFIKENLNDLVCCRVEMKKSMMII